MSLAMLAKNGGIVCVTICSCRCHQDWLTSAVLALHQMSYHMMTDNFISQTEEERKDRISRPCLLPVDLFLIIAIPVI